MNEQAPWLRIVAYREFYDYPRVMVLETPFVWLYLIASLTKLLTIMPRSFSCTGLACQALLVCRWTGPHIGADSGAPIATIPVGAIEFDVTRRAHERLPHASNPAKG